MTALRRPFADRTFRRLIWLLVAAIGWTGVALLGAALFAQRPPHAGFDLALVLEAGRRVGAGTSPYLAGAVGQGTQVESLFYSYPPPVAQAASLIAGLPVGLLLLLAGAAATLGFAAFVMTFARLAAPGQAGVDSVLPALALAPFVYPFTIALLFGNVDAWFPLAYGGALLAATTGTTRWRIGGGIAIGLVSLAKLHPAAILGWLAIRGLREARDIGLGPAPEGGRGPAPGDGRRPAGRGSSMPSAATAAWRTLGVAVATIVAVAAVSLAIWGPGQWAEYVNVLRAGTAADFVSRLNIGPASQLALLTGDDGIAVRVAPAVTAVALGLTAAAAWLLRPVTLSLAVAAAASLIVTPITWFHYPVALLPFAAAAWLQTRDSGHATRTAALLVAALVVAGLSISEPVAVWLAVGLVIVACRSPAQRAGA